ncbi:MAG TPA: glycosyltransferase family 2 protein [Ktedonobacteraceae bacterium]
MRISVIVPVYNEETTVAQVLDALAQVPLDMEVIVVDDASTDRTWTILQELRQRAPFNTYQYLRHERNLGKGVGLRTGFARASGELVTIQDADMEYNPQDLPKLVSRWESASDSWTAVYGQRNFAGQKIATQLGNHGLTWLTNILYGCHIHDMETCYKLIPGPLARALPMEGRRFEIEPEITACVVQAGCAILEVPIDYKPRKEKKLNPWKDGWPALEMLFRRKFIKRFHYTGPRTLTQSQPDNTSTPEADLQKLVQ